MPDVCIKFSKIFIYLKVIPIQLQKFYIDYKRNNDEFQEI